MASTESSTTTNRSETGSGGWSTLTPEQQLHQLWSRDQIRELTARYCWGVAHGDVEALVALFAKDGAFDARGVGIGYHQGHDQLRPYFAKYTPPGVRFPYIHNHVIEMDGDSEASGTCSAEVLSLRDGQIVSTPGFYHDRFRLENGAWKFLERKANQLKLAPMDEELSKKT